jgi:hypothetical protein
MAMYLAKTAIPAMTGVRIAKDITRFSPFPSFVAMKKLPQHPMTISAISLEDQNTDDDPTRPMTRAKETKSGIRVRSSELRCETIISDTPIT